MGEHTNIIEAPGVVRTMKGATDLLDRGLAAIAAGGSVVIDMTNAGPIGPNGAATLLALYKAAEDDGVRFAVRGLSTAHIRELQAIPAPDLRSEAEEPATSLTFYLGSIAQDVADQVLDFLSLIAETIYWCLRLLVRSGPWRRGQFVREALAIGNEGLPIIATVALLVGLVTAFQAADQLRQFGASIFIANLVGLGVLREMGPLITAILVVGRSGSAMAAELGTMAVEEEIDALRVMGIDPVPYLVVPKALATLVAVPALTMLANLFGIAGGFAIAVLYLDLAPDAFFHQFRQGIVAADLLTGMFKSLLFSVVIFTVGCHFGLRLRGGAEDVGRAATNAVVASLFLIILVDGVYVTISTLMR